MRIGGAFPVAPLGISLRDRGRFRSEALALVGSPVAWDDLSTVARAGGQPERETVDQLTVRIEAALRRRQRELFQRLERLRRPPAR